MSKKRGPIALIVIDGWGYSASRDGNAISLAKTTGKLDKTIEACQYADTCLGRIMKRVREARGITLITADHGNAEQMIDPITGGPHTAHTTTTLTTILERAFVVIRASLSEARGTRLQRSR